MDRTRDGQPLKMLTVMDEYTRECLAIDVERGIRSQDVLHRLSELFLWRGTPKFIRSDNGPEFTARAVRKWLERVGVGTLFIEPGSPWENGYIESFNGKFRDNLLNCELFDTLTEAKILIERWRKHYNQVRSHSSLGYKPPAPETISPWAHDSATLRPDPMAIPEILTHPVAPLQGAGHTQFHLYLFVNCFGLTPNYSLDFYRHLLLSPCICYNTKSTIMIWSKRWHGLIC